MARPPTEHRKNSKGERVHIFHHAQDARERGVLDWISNSDFNDDENHIFFDFETVPTGAKDDDGKNSLSPLAQEPFEIGFSVRTSTGEIKHRSFMFTPPKINFHAQNPETAGFDPGKTFHDDAMRFHITTDTLGGLVKTVRQKEEDAPDGRYEHLERVLKPYTMGEGEHVAVPWGEIDNFLIQECGVDPKKVTNFAAHNGGFDFPILERMFAKSGGRRTQFGALYKRVNDTGQVKWSGNTSQPWYGGYLNDRQGTDGGSKGRRSGDKTRGGHRHDTMVELMRLFGNTFKGQGNKIDSGSESENNQMFVLRKAHNTGSLRSKSGNIRATYHQTWNKAGYAPGKEYAGGSGFASGTSMDDFRAAIGFCAFAKNANNPVNNLFEEMKTSVDAWVEAEKRIQASNLNDDEKNDAISKLSVHRLLDGTNLNAAFIKELEHSQYKAKTAKDYFRAFNAVAAHEGAGDTAFTTEVMYPFLETIIKLFDHDKYHPFDADNNFIPNQGDAFMNAFQKFQDNWGGILGGMPKKGDRNGTHDCPALRTSSPSGKSKFKAGSGHELLDGIKLALNNANDDANRDRWFDSEGNHLSGLLAPISQQASMDLNVQPPPRQERGKPTSRPTASDVGDSVISDMNQNMRLPNTSDFPEALQSYITGPITMRKWQGSDNRGPRIVVSVPLGNSRLTFSESYWGANSQHDPKVSYKPLLGAVAIGSDKGNPKIRGAREYLRQLLVDFGHNHDSQCLPNIKECEEKGKAPFGNIGRAIQKVLSDKHDVMTKAMEDQPIANHREINDFINTPASAWLSQSLGDAPLSSDAEVRALGMPVQDNDPNGSRTYTEYINQVFRVLAQLNEGDDPLAAAKKQMLFGAPHLVGHLEQFNEQFNPEEMFNQFLNKNQLDPALYTLNMEGDPNAPVFAPTDGGGQEVNMARVVTSFLSGNEATDQAGNLIEGLHPQQFLHPDAVGQGGLLSALFNYLDFSYQTGILGQNVDMFEQYGITPRKPHSTQIEASQGVLGGIVTDPEGDESEQGDIADIIVSTTPTSGVSDEISEKASEDAKQTKANQETFDDLRSNSSSTQGFKDDIQALLDSLGINGASPFVTDNYIESIRGQESVDSAYDALFPTRESGKTLDEVQGLLDDAVTLYGEKSDKRNAANLVRELEWIRMNHEEVFNKDAVSQALNTNDSQSVQGQYLDIMNQAYNAMGDTAGANLALIQEEQTQMGDRFMTNAHRQYLFNAHSDEHEDNWYDVDDPTTIQEHFTPEPEEETRGLRDIARDMAVATAKTPLNALKYYTNWNALSEQWKDEVSGRREAGEKLLGAVRRGEKFREVNIGTEDEPQYAATEQEYNYYIGNLPVQSEHQPSILRQFLQGKRTYGDLMVEDEQSQARVRSNADQVINEQREWEQNRIKERAAWTTDEITSEQQDTGAAHNDIFTRERSDYADQVRGAVEQVRGTTPPPPVDPNNRVVIGGKERPDLISPDTPPVAKSLDELREYLLRV